MENKQYIVTLEIGSSKIVGVIVSKTITTGMSSVIAVEEEKISDCVRYGCVKNVEETKMHINAVIRRLETHIGTNKVSGIYVGIAGRSLRSIPHEVTLSLNGLNGITSETIETLLNEARQEVFTGFDILEVTPQRFLVDNVENKKPIGTFGSEIEASINIIVAKSLLKANIRRVIDSNIEIKGLIVTPLAVGNSILSAQARLLGCMLIDMGAETTTVSIYKNDALMYLATLPLGGRNITRDVMSLQLLEESAEELKKSIGNAKATSSNNDISYNGMPVNEAANYISARSGEIAANINEQLSFAGVKSSDLPEGIILIGGASHLNGFADLLEQTTKMKVTRGSYPEGIDILDSHTLSCDRIPAIALAKAAAAIIPNNENCIRRAQPDPHLEFEGTHPGSNPKTEHGKKQTKDSEKKDPKDSKMKSIFNRFKGIFDEDENESDDE